MSKPREWTKSEEREIKAEIAKGTPLTQLAKDYNTTRDVMGRLKKKFFTPLEILAYLPFFFLDYSGNVQHQMLHFGQQYSPFLFQPYSNLHFLICHGWIKWDLVSSLLAL